MNTNIYNDIINAMHNDIINAMPYALHPDFNTVLESKYMNKCTMEDFKDVTHARLTTVNDHAYKMSLIAGHVYKISSICNKYIEIFDHMGNILAFNYSCFEPVFYEEITPYNIEEVWNNSNKINNWDIIISRIDKIQFKFFNTASMNKEAIYTEDFKEFLEFVQKRVKLIPLEKKTEFNAKQYLLDSGYFKECPGIMGLLVNNSEYMNHICVPHKKWVKENCDILIEAAKILNKLEIANA